MPIEQLGGDGDMVDRTRSLLTTKDVSHKLRTNTVLAYEDVYGASPEYWEQRYPGGWKNVSVEELQRDSLATVLMKHVRGKYGDKLVSVRLHVDEKTPHWHVVSIPLVTREHKQRGRKRKDGVVPPPVMKTTLYASHPDERGGSGRRLEAEHDQWAASTAHLGLVRGARGSDLTEEEKRDRRLRDQQSSRQGEDRARVRRDERLRVDAAQKLVETAAGDFVRIVEQGRTDAAAIVAAADATARKAAAEADREAAAIRLTAQAEADRLARGVREQAERDAAAIRTTAKIEADRAAKAVRDKAEREAAVVLAAAQSEIDRRADDAVKEREAAIAMLERQLERGRSDLTVRSQAVVVRGKILDDQAARIVQREGLVADREVAADRRYGVLDVLIAELEPLLKIVRDLEERLKSAPTIVRQWLDRTDVGATVSRVLLKGPSLVDQAREAVRARGPNATVAQARGPNAAAAPALPEVDESPSVVEQALALGGGRGGR